MGWSVTTGDTEPESPGGALLVEADVQGSGQPQVGVLGLPQLTEERSLQAVSPTTSKSKNRTSLIGTVG
ncbi:hypothetical protein [Spirosoma sp. 48-14]|uniref:hypothetical protein n=1 Tax=Spirosoma sp. 48-14 TaxID=1895854 RepID=UPI0009655A73|nr:hypothetical protein [Spirosoma sp. 48-14]OJW79330.1 MAG: hypothetical protein BGO59_12400 [Spirosoma sp. 48-14]